MARRLSAMFSVNKEEGSLVTAEPHIQDLRNASPARLHKQHSGLGLGPNLALNTATGVPLEPPPTFHETASGAISSKRASQTYSPASSHGRRGSIPFGSASSRESSRSRPQTPVYLAPPGAPVSPVVTSPTSPQSAKLAKKKSWFQGGKSDKHKFGAGDGQPSRAWIAGLREQIPYNLDSLLRGEQTPEIWDDKGDVLVYLFPQATGRGPSFRVPSSVFADSRSLNYLTVSTMDSSFQNLTMNNEDGFGQYLDPRGAQRGHSREGSGPKSNTSQSNLKTLYLPLELEGDYSARGTLPRDDDLELIVLYRNFFAFLGGGALISTPRQVSLYSIFMGVASILRRLQYSNADGSTFGEVPSNSFARYCDELRLADVRASREKNIEAIVLGEQMRYWPLYNEGFVHAAGRLEDIKSVHSPKYGKITPVTANRLERAHLDVEARLRGIRTKLSDFDFPSMFSGIANSQTATEARLIRFKAWKLAFLDMRKFTLAQYRYRYGSWPPKASSKKNNFEESGFNRLLVREMYKDFTDLYDMLVNRKMITTRTADMKPMTDDAAGYDKSETIQHALRTIESEYDRSTPPVLPPIPFDTPIIPAYSQSFKGGNVMKSSKDSSRKLQSSELNELLLGSYNRENIRPTPWIQEFMAYERKLCAGASLDNIVDYRCGQWLFMYAVLQSLPMAAVDARDVKFTEGAEYFLFAAPRGGKPWMREDTTTSRAWYNVSSGGTVVSLPADALDHQPEGVYRRSHCWLVANQWLGDTNVIAAQSTTPPPYSPPSSTHLGMPVLQSPPSTQQSVSMGSQRLAPSPQHSPYLAAQPGLSPHLSPAHSPQLGPVSSINGDQTRQGGLPRVASLNSMNAGYEEIAAPAKPARPVSTYNPNITFDSILGSTDPKAKKKK